jgi:phosphoglycolate phosphatase
MTKYKGIIFDLDGTLLDTIDDLGDSMNEVLKTYNYPTFISEEYKLKVGGGFKGLVLNSFPKGTDLDIIEEATVLFSNIYDERYLNKPKPYDGIDSILEELNKMGIKMGINSNKKDKYTNNLTDKFFKRIPFIAVYGEREGVQKKPNPTSALEIIQLMGLKSEEVLYIGDSMVDIMTANNAGIDSVGVLWGFRNHEELSKFGATYIISDAKEILSIIQ